MPPLCAAMLTMYPGSFRPCLLLTILVSLAAVAAATPSSTEESLACPLEGPLADVCAAYDSAEEDSALNLLQRRSLRLRGQAAGVQERAEDATEDGDTSADEDSDPPTLNNGFSKLSTPCGEDGDAKLCADAIVKSAALAFKALAKKTAKDQGTSYTTEETKEFKQRFEESLAEATKSTVDSRTVTSGFAEWRALATKLWDKARPVVTQAMVNEVNGKKLGWEAQYDPSMPSKSIEDAEKLLGLTMDSHEASLLFNETQRREKHDLLEIGNWKDVQGPFDGRDHWPGCSDVLRHVRFQTCGNCWSHSSALVAESRLCIASGGKFRGRDAWLSQSYIAACRPDGMDYCAGGSGTVGFNTISQWGVPTGGSDTRGNTAPDAVTCLPQYLPHQDNVRCPSKCSPYQPYPRSLKKDLFYLRFNPRGVHPQGAQTLQLVKQTLYNEGPILIGFTAYADFYAYKSGIYRPLQSPSNQKIGGHAVTGMGFGPGYILCVNSWGPTFGDNGAFKVAPEAIDFGYFLPGAANWAVSSLPIMLPSMKR